METRSAITEELTRIQTSPKPRRVQVLKLVGVAPSTWYLSSLDESLRKRPGPPPKRVADEVARGTKTMATDNPWYSYTKIAVMCRRAHQAVTDRDAYTIMRDHGLLHKPRVRVAELYQAARLLERLPQQPNELWQLDVTYIHIPGHGWWYAVTVMDYYSRYLLNCHLTSSHSALEIVNLLTLAREEAARICGPLSKRLFLVTDNGSSLIARRFVDFVGDKYSHVRIRYRTPQQLGLLERFHRTLKTEDVYWRLYNNPQHARGCLAEF